MKFLSKFNEFTRINEATATPEQLRGKHFQKKTPVDVALLTFKEYHELVNPDGKYHDSHIWNYSIADLNQTPPNMSKKDLFLRKKFGNLEIEFYRSNEKLQYGRRDEKGEYHSLTDAEIKKAGLPEKEITMYAFHDGKEIGFIADEWGATLVAIAREYKGSGIGKYLTYLFRKEHPDRASGGLTDAGYKNLKNVYREFVKEYLRNGIYSDLVRKGELTKERANEIIKSADLQNYKPEQKLSSYAKHYNTKDLNDNLLFWRFSDTDFILFDKAILEYYKEDNDIVDHFLKAHIYLAYNPYLENYELYNSYGISEKFEAILLNVALETIKFEEDAGATIRVTEDLTDQTLRIVDRFKKSGKFEVTKNKDYENIKAKEGMDFKPLFAKAKMFIKKNDKYEELSTFISELAYQRSDYAKKATV